MYGSISRRAPLNNIHQIMDLTEKLISNVFKLIENGSKPRNFNTKIIIEIPKLCFDFILLKMLLQTVVKLYISEIISEIKCLFV